MLFKLLTAPVTMPVSGFRFILEQLQQMAERELYNEATIREDLLLLQLRLEEGEITEEEYRAQEAEIMARLRAARAYRQARGGVR
jgi:uncharacterized membrane protein